MLAIAAAWPDLLTKLGREGSAASDGMPKPVSRTPGLVINEHISQTMAEVREWVTFLTRVLIDEAKWTPPHTDTPRLITRIARERIGHFTEHPDDLLRMAFYDDAVEMRRKVERAAYPDGYRTLDTRIPCEEHGTSDAGERIVCAGTYTVRPRADGVMPDLICSAERQHRVSPVEWSRSSWKLAHEQRAAS